MNTYTIQIDEAQRQLIIAGLKLLREHDADDSEDAIELIDLVEMFEDDDAILESADGINWFCF